MNHENLRRYPHHFGSFLSPSASENHRSGKRLVISGNIANAKDHLEKLLNSLGINNYSIYNNQEEEGYLVTLATSDNAKEVLKMISENLKVNQIKNLTVKFYEPKDERNVYVKNLPLHFTEAQLLNLFEPYGSIISKKIIMKSANNNSIGFVRYTTKGEAEKAILGINNQHLNLLNNDRPVRCELSKTSSPATNTDSQNVNLGFYPHVGIPRFQNFPCPEGNNLPSPYLNNNIQHNSAPYFQMASQFSNMSLLANNIYYPTSYLPNNPSFSNQFTVNYPANYPYIIYPPLHQNYNYYNNS